MKEPSFLVTRHQGRIVPTVAGIPLFGTLRERYFPDAWIQSGCFGGADKARIIDQRDIKNYLPPSSCYPQIGNDIHCFILIDAQYKAIPVYSSPP